MKRVLSFLLILSCFFSVFTFPSGAALYKISDEGMLPFEDVGENSWYKDSVIFCYVNSVIKGMNGYTFAPGTSLTRAQFVVMLASLEGVDTSTYSIERFTDVKSSHWYYGAVAWAYENGIVSGTSENRFSPNAEINRQTLARMMHLYMLSKGYEVTVDENILDRFADRKDTDEWALEGLTYTVSAGLISGMTETTVAPKAKLTRAQAARIMMLYMQDYFYGSCEHSFTKADCTHSRVCEKCSMAEGLPEGHHVSVYYNCRESDKCTVCGSYVPPSKILHTYAAANCARAAVCTTCGGYRGEKDPNGHNFFKVSCTKPKYCQRCGYSEGSPLGHTTNCGVCARCYKEVFENDYKKVAWYMVKRGTPDGMGHYTVNKYDEYWDGSMSYRELYYDAHTGSFILQKLQYIGPANRYDQLIITIPALLDTYRCDYREYSENGELIGSGVGYFDPSKVDCNRSADINWTSMKGKRNTDYMKSSAEDMLRYIVSDIDLLIYGLCGETAIALGFDHPSYAVDTNRKNMIS